MALRRVHVAPVKAHSTFNVPLVLAGAALGTLTTIWITDSWLFSWDFSLFGLFHQQRLVQFVAGSAVGFLLYEWRHPHSLTVLRAGVLATLFVVGPGPSYWALFLDSLGISRIGPVERTIARFDSSLDYLTLEFAQPGDKTTYSDYLALVGHAPILVDRDFVYMNGILGSNTFTNLNRSLHLAIKTTTAAVARCALQIEQQLPSLMRTKTNSILLDFALALDNSLKTDKYSLQEKVDAITALVEDTLSALAALGTATHSNDGSKYCTFDGNVDINKWQASVKNLVSYAQAFPYSAMAIAHIYNRLGDKEAARKTLNDWMDDYTLGTTNEVDNARPTEPLEDVPGLQVGENVRRVMFVRLLTDLSLIEKESEPSVMEFVQRQTLEATWQLLESAERRDAVHSDVGAVCKKTATAIAPSFDRIIFQELANKNNYADAAAEELRDLIGRENLSSVELEAIRFDEAKAIGFANDVSEYPIGICFGQLLSQELVHYFRASFLDTQASLRAYRAFLDLKLKLSDEGEIVHDIGGSLQEWSLAQELLRPIVRNDELYGDLYTDIGNKVAKFRSLLFSVGN
ncbi:MAG: hypothetical protein OXU19_15780 [bacterium]|nr:hypothetical protein [bacterium]MDE0242482.1 hypothetical protein [bacterium]